MEIQKNKSNLSENNSIFNSLNVSSFRDSVVADGDTQSNIKRKRRSKNDPNGRMFKCACGKAYLSALALSNHIKSKHSSDNKNVSESETNKNINLYNNLNNFNHSHLFNHDEYQRKRGRPKKKFTVMNNNLEINYHLFFHKEHRRRTETEKIEITPLLNKIFNDIYEKKNEKENFRIDNHNFFKYFFHDNKFFNKNGLASSDEIFVRYLEEVSLLTNREYFIFIIKFVIIFRDCINKYKNIELENSAFILNETLPESVKEFTQYHDAEQIPELCNEFLTDYLIEEHAQLRNDYLSDFIEIIQHFCHWLYENNYSSSRLLLNN